MMDVKALKLNYNIASMMVYEQVTGKPFQLDGSMTSMVLLIWSIIEANNPGTIALKDMIAWLDDNPEDMRYLVAEVSRLIKISSGLVDADGDEDKKKSEPLSVTELFEAIVGLGADPQWVLYDLRLSMYDVVMRALARRQREEWERTRVATIIGAQASGARLKWDDLPNPYYSTDKQPAKCSDIEAARKRLKELKRKENESD